MIEKKKQKALSVKGLTTKGTKEIAKAERWGFRIGARCYHLTVEK